MRWVEKEGKDHMLMELQVGNDGEDMERCWGEVKASNGQDGCTQILLCAHPALRNADLS